MPDAAVRDALEIAARVAADERAAAEVRARHRAGDRPCLDPDPSVAALLADTEHVIEIRPAAFLQHTSAGLASRPLAGRLYVTTRRMLVLGTETLAVELGSIDELSLTGERLLVSLADGSGLQLDVTGPRSLRAHLAAAIADLRAA